MHDQQQPESVAYWEVDETTGDVKDLGSYTNWQDQ